MSFRSAFDKYRCSLYQITIHFLQPLSFNFICHTQYYFHKPIRPDLKLRRSQAENKTRRNFGKRIISELNWEEFCSTLPHHLHIYLEVFFLLKNRLC